MNGKNYGWRNAMQTKRTHEIINETRTLKFEMANGQTSTTVFVVDMVKLLYSAQPKSIFDITFSMTWFVCALPFSISVKLEQTNKIDEKLKIIENKMDIFRWPMHSSLFSYLNEYLMNTNIGKHQNQVIN